MEIKVLAVDDELSILFGIRSCLEDYYLTTIDNPLKALELAEKEEFHIIITDYKMPEMNGLDFLKKVKKNNPDAVALLLTAYADKNILEEAINNNLIMKIMEKPVQLEELKRAVDDIAKTLKELTDEKERVSQLENVFTEMKEQYNSSQKVIGIDKGLSHIAEKVKHISSYPINVIITGETGTGKEVFADLIHNMSPRKDQICVKINCAAIPEALLEGELFGYKKGAFTGAVTDKIGKIAMAHKGTLFLDEIGDLKLDLQAKLLRVLQEKKVVRLGENKSTDVDFRLICATHIDLQGAIKKKKFREDLFYRLNGFPIHLPPLRERYEDMKDLIHYFVGKSCYDMNIPVKGVNPGVVESLQKYNWPGNLRELENAVTRAVILSYDRENIETCDFEFLYDTTSEENAYYRALSIIGNELFKDTISLKDLENDILNFVLESCDGQISLAVAKTGIPKDRFYRVKKMDQ